MSRISDKEFEKRLEACLNSYTAEDYIRYIRLKAENISPSEREYFISTLESVKQQNKQVSSDGSNIALVKRNLDEYVNDLMLRIDAYKEEYDDLVGRYTNDEYDDDEYERSAPYYHGYYSDDGLSFDEMNGYGDLKEEGYEILLSARDLFIEKHYTYARMVYEKIVNVLEDMDYEVFSVYSEKEDVLIYEELMRFLCAVYLTESDARLRSGDIYDFMKGGIFDTKYINLKSLVEFANGKLIGTDEFLPVWKEYLLIQIYEKADKNTNYLLREAARMVNGIDGIIDLAQNHGEVCPESYIDWVELELKEERDITDICIQAIENVKIAKVGLKICEYLVWQSAINGNMGNCLLAFKKSLNYEIEFKYFIHMLKYAKMENCLDESIEYVLDLLERKASDEQRQEFIFHIRLIKGEHEEVYLNCKNPAELGWSSYYTNTPVFIGFLFKLFYKCGKGSANKTANFMAGVTGKIKSFWEYYSKRFGKDDIYTALIDDAINGIVLTDTKISEYYKWCEKICCKRVDEIVSKQYRNAYDSAAIALLACAEAKAILYGPQEGDALTKKYIDKYPKHINFRKAMRSN